ncbi:MAG: phosphotransferase [Bacteroidales bacterium]|nr:phosphotransferase [Bacteroidales bacterium]
MMFQLSILTTFAAAYAGRAVAKSEPIAQSGSHRVYTRLLFADGTTIMGAYNDDLKENEAFFAFTESFLREGINVPKILFISEDRAYYLLQDLGDETLFGYLSRRRKEAGGTDTPADVLDLFREALRQLPRLQLAARHGLDFSRCYPCEEFGQQAMQWDLNYFKYYFLKLAYIPFDEQTLENDFQTLIRELLRARHDYFMYRDFQSRNIMIHEGELYFIDYQGGRKGALQYDLSSLLFQAKAQLTTAEREELLEFYLDELEKHEPVDRDEFRRQYYGYVLIRLLQVLGAYGYRGYFERKPHFLQSIPPAVENLRYLLDSGKIPPAMPALTAVLQEITSRTWTLPEPPAGVLTVEVGSFSFKKGLPADDSGNGGGFIFDCRALPNPGREVRYRQSTGRDRDVIEYLEQYPVVDEFKQHVFRVLDMSVDNYLERGFTHLSAYFGCTGGQHRSVYFAQQAADHLRTKYPQVNVVLKHREQDSL